MKISVSQIYIEAGVNFPFNHRFQNYLARELTAMELKSTEFAERFGADWEIIFRISAKAALAESELRGPTVFKKDRDVEYSIFLPYTPLMVEWHKTNTHAETIRHIVIGIADALDLLGVDATPVRVRANEFLKAILTDTSMVDPT